MMTAVDWWKTIIGAPLLATSVTSVKWNFLRIVGNVCDVRGERRFVAHCVTVYPHLSHAQSTACPCGVRVTILWTQYLIKAPSLIFPHGADTIPSVLRCSYSEPRSSESMSTILITGANRGLGLEFACQYAADGWDVLAASRQPQKNAELKQSTAKYPKVVLQA